MPVTDSPSEVSDVEAPVRDGRGVGGHLVEAEAGLDLVFEGDYVYLTRFHRSLAAWTLVDGDQLIGHDPDVVPVRFGTKRDGSPRR